MHVLLPRCLSAVLLLGCVSFLKSQAPKPAVSGSDRWAKEPVVLEDVERSYTLNEDGTGRFQMRSVVHVQAESMLNQYSVVTVSYASASQKVQFQYVRTRHPDGSTTETPLTGVQEQSPEVTRQAPFYSDIKLVQLPVKNLRAGDRLEWEASVDTLKPEAPGQFWGAEQFIQGQGVVLKEQLTLDLPAQKFVQVWTNPRFQGVHHEALNNGRREERWESTDLTATAGPEAEAEKKRKETTPLTAEQNLEARKGKLPDVAWTTFHSWDEVGGWYRGLEAGRTDPDAAIKAKVAELTAGKTTEEDKVRAVYTYVSTQVRYIGVALGVGRYQPHTAGVVLENQYGDCKDKHTLLAAMLRVLGLEPSAVLIGASIRFNEAVPSPASFNHLITQVQTGGNMLWLDSTEEVAPMGALMLPLRDQPALVVPSSGAARVDRTPAALPYPAFAKAEIAAKLADDLTSDSTFKLTYRDDDELALRAVLRQVPASRYDELVQQLLVGWGFGGTSSEATISAIDDLATPLMISFHYHRVKQAEWGENRVTLAFLPVSLPVMDPDKPPVGEIALGPPRTETSTTEEALPAGWRAELPETVHQHTAFADADVTYRQQAGTLFAERRVTVHQAYVPAADWKSYKAWYDAASVSGAPYVQLDPPSHAGSSASRESGASNEKAADLIRQSYAAIQSNDMTGARALLAQAEQRNATERGLWATYGWLSFRSGDSAAAVLDYRKELAMHPGQSAVYRSMVQTQVLAEQRDNAIDTARSWIREDPQNPDALTTLVNLLREAGKAQEAVDAAETNSSHLPDSARSNIALQLATGRAELAAGLRPKGEATLGALLKAESPMVRNDAAYELADANLELAEAETAQKAALADLAKQSQASTLEENLPQARARGMGLAACWDTMGWILYKQGKLSEAERYLQAAWRARGDAVVGEHLGEVQSALGQHRKALTTYQAALASAVRYSNLGIRQPPSPQAIKLQEHIREEKRRLPGSSPADGQAALQKLRVVPLGRAPDAGTVEVRLLLAGGHIVQSAAKDAAHSLTSAQTDLLKQADLSEFFPDGSDAQLVRVGVLNCHAGTCELVLEP